jgi:hypothetical protein
MGFLGKMSSAFTGLYPSGDRFSDKAFDEAEMLSILGAGRLLQDTMQMVDKGITRIKLNKRVIIRGMSFKTGIFDLKIIQII